MNNSTAIITGSHEYVDNSTPMITENHEYVEEVITKNLWQIIPPIFIIVGTIGNILSVIILLQPKIVKSTSALYLIVLAFSDTVVLYTGLMRHWLQYEFGLHVRHYSEAGCKIHIFLTYFSLDFSAWLLVAVTFDRLVLVWFPHKAKHRCTKSTGCIIISTIFVFLVAVNAHILHGSASRNITEGNITTYKNCEFIDDSYKLFFNETWPWIDFAIFSLIPFCCLLIGNTLISIKILKWHKEKSRRTSTKNNNSGPNTRMSSITLMLFTLNTVFLFCTTPISIYNIFEDQSRTSWTDYDYARHDLHWSICNILMYFNNTFNFLLYIFSGSRFRNEAKSLFFQGCHKLFCKSHAYVKAVPVKDDLTHENGV